jgi:hypothetical protein
MSSQDDDGEPGFKFDQNDFLKEFYKECGREVTLAYTTLNQMKNWAIVVSAAIAAAIASMLKSPAFTTHESDAQLVFLGAMLAYLFTLRFFVRAIICYVNLLRWNRLQSDIARLKLSFDSRSTKSKSELQDEVSSSVDLYYHRWLSTIGRWAQITSNLKLGFGLLLVLPVFAMVWSGVVSWATCYTRAATIFVIGGTAIELYEFMTTSFLDTKEVSSRRNANDRNRFPGPSGKSTTFAMWTALLIVSSAYLLYCTGMLCPN